MNHLSKIAFLIIGLCLVFTAGPAIAGWSELLDIFKKSGATEAALTQDEVISGLKQALQKGNRFAVEQLGRKDGFFKDPQLKIPLPKQLQRAESVLRSLKQDELADDFVLSMNRAAEQAVPVAGEILLGIVQNMSVEDAFGILNGPDDAATRYLRSNGESRLSSQFLPVVAETTDRVGVTRYYKSLIDRLGMMSSLVDTDSLDIDSYVTEQAIDGLFQLIAEQEQLIRQDPTARTTELLKRVFGNSQ